MDNIAKEPKYWFMLWGKLWPISWEGYLIWFIQLSFVLVLIIPILNNLDSGNIDLKSIVEILVFITVIILPYIVFNKHIKRGL